MPPAKNQPSRSSGKQTEPTDKVSGEASSTQSPVEVSPDETKAADPVEVSPQQPDNHDDTDVPASLKRQTQDGKGDDEVPESDFESFATDDVEKGQKSVEDLASEVLDGKWGEGDERRRRLDSSGYDSVEVQIEVNRRLVGGAPAAHTPDTKELAKQVIRGEWGSNDEDIRRNLERAGYNVTQVVLEVSRQLGA